ncbi:MAG TPA: HEPN domain-containing protein [Spirochaetia bacterium]|nr:HEPN domain-containing protein [Spirochaetia bacterium]
MDEGFFLWLEKLHIGWTSAAVPSAPHTMYKPGAAWMRGERPCMTPEAKEWLRQAKENLKDARAMLRTRRYVFADFACHLAVEKALKAVIVERTGAPPPRRHNLIELAGVGQAPLTQIQTEFIAELNMAALGARYPDKLSQAAKQYPGPTISEYVKKAGEIIKCLENAPPLKV